jgi:hypothetical protein
MFTLIEAIHSVALEHPGDCPCVVCRAADGEMDALIEILVMMEKIDARGLPSGEGVPDEA